MKDIHKNDVTLRNMNYVITYVIITDVGHVLVGSELQ